MESIEVTKIQTGDLQKYKMRAFPFPLRVALKLHVVDFKGKTRKPASKTSQKAKGR